MPKYELMTEPGLIAGMQASSEGVSQVKVWRLLVWDGELRCVTAMMPTGWTMTISHGSIGRKGNVKKKRYPTMPEIAKARAELLPDMPFICTVPTLSETDELKDTTVELFQFPPLDPEAPKPVEERLASGLIVPVS